MARILAIHAHPDDCEIFAGGTLAILASLGHEVTIVTMTPGDCGTHHYSPEEIAKIRKGEAARAAEIIGARYECAEFRDLAIFNDDPSRRRVTEYLRKLRPEIVLTSYPVDYHCDHEATSALVRDACFAAPAENYRTGGLDGNAPLHRLDEIPHLYFMDPAEGRDRKGGQVIPEFVVNVQQTFGTKREMLAQHQSQAVWLAEHHHMPDYLDEMQKWTRAVGDLAGIELGEGFTQYRGHPYPATPLLQELLGDRIVWLGQRPQA